MLKQIANLCLGPTLAETTRRATKKARALKASRAAKKNEKIRNRSTGTLPLNGDQKLEKSVMSLFGILLQLIVFYLPLLNATFRGKMTAYLII